MRRNNSLAQASAKSGSFTTTSSSIRGIRLSNSARSASKRAASASGSWKGWPLALMMLTARRGSKTLTGPL